MQDQSPLTGFDLVVVAASLGGLEALSGVFSGLPADFPVPILAVQHLSETFPSSLPYLLAGRTRLRVHWARDGMRPRAGNVYMAPPGRHLSVPSRRRLRISGGPRVSYARPSGDVLFASSARIFGSRTLGVVLTGRLRDGAAGAEEIRRRGGVVIAQDPRTCAAPGMPQATIRRGAADFVLAPESIPSALVSLVMVPGVRALFGLERRPA
jgi:two-component system chemotaxis response regulator CheB